MWFKITQYHHPNTGVGVSGGRGTYAIERSTRDLMLSLQTCLQELCHSIHQVACSILEPKEVHAFIFPQTFDIPLKSYKSPISICSSKGGVTRFIAIVALTPANVGDDHPYWTDSDG